MTRHARFLLSTNSSSTPAAEPPSAVAVESDFVVILAALLCALICVVGLIAVARCAWLRRGTGAGGNGGSQPSANKGLKKKVLQSLPKFTYDPSSSTAPAPANNGAPFTAECAICLAEYAVGDEIRVLPQCGHSFHLQCIDTWLGSHSSCPSCRQILVVARCRKCGEFPAVSCKSDGAPVSTPAESRSCGTSTSSNNFLV
ncbi:RING-H2 finger protein ATL80 [Capsicum annuum]|uniref:RING-H2 finger protein ATL8 n=1 Tax=Capsicum annuum TaxID=4072 RepID=UPI0007BF06FB|nr:RING-H2 finger protein ATL8 [Capsicum annuum]KAF3667395.1 RING-H2 finger protein ATL80 [Capsicum annuum]KAF3670594.1 RING-H2 finger protein ATL80 [Capsicum annuum]